MAFGSLLCFLQQADRWDDVPCLRRISKQWLRYSLTMAAYGCDNAEEYSRNYRYGYIHIKKVEPKAKKESTPAVKGYIIRQICSRMDIKTEEQDAESRYVMYVMCLLFSCDRK